MDMKTTLRYLSLNAQATWHRQVDEQLKHLHSLTAITSADVVLEHQQTAKPAFRVQVRLEVPGPGVHARATRHTRQAALLIHGPALHAEERGNTLEAALLQGHPGLGTPGSSPATQALGTGQKQTATQRRFQPVDQHSGWPKVKLSMNPGAMKMNTMKNRAVERPFIRPLADVVAPAEPEDFARFEGEGGREAPLPDLVDVPLYNAIRRRPRWVAQLANQQNMTI
jgi:hypothetical protein